MWAAIIGGAVGVTRAVRVLFVAVALAAGLTLIISLCPISEIIAAHWVRNDPISQADFGAVVSLSASINPDTTISAEAADHLIFAADLAVARNARIVVTTTAVVPYPAGPIDSRVDQARLIKRFGDGLEWLHTSITTSTRDEAVTSAALLHPRGIRRIAVVASPVHTRRACATFEAVGFVVTCVASRNRDPNAQLLGQTPSDRLSVFGAWIYELAATLKYRIHGWLPRAA